MTQNTFIDTHERNEMPVVAIQKTGLRRYSHDLLAPVVPERDAIAQLRAQFRAASGVDLFLDMIKPGDRVVIKPNLVRDWHPDGLDLYALITHPALIRAVVDHVYEALRGDGEIVIADAPMGDTDWEHLLAVTGLHRVAEYYRRTHDFPITILDLRKYRYTMQHGPHGYGHEVRHDLPGDPAGYVEVDLGSASAFADLPNAHLLQGTDVARRAETVAHHTATTNKYLIARSILHADVLISMPKLKTHGKVGVTINAKNMVGINGDKNYLPHYRWGSTSDGGDQHPAGDVARRDEQRMRLGRLVADHVLARNTRWSAMAVRMLQHASGAAATLAKLPPITPLNGHWPGNDTCWRLPADLLRLAVFADRRGVMRPTPQRRFISIVDGIVGGEGDGPLRATPKACGVLLAGTYPLAVDLVAARVMGFDPLRIKQLTDLAQGGAAQLVPGLGACEPHAINIASNYAPWCGLFGSDDRWLGFEAPPRWETAIAVRDVVETPA